jgi:hypothetical protein
MMFSIIGSWKTKGTMGWARQDKGWLDLFCFSFFL